MKIYRGRNPDSNSFEYFVNEKCLFSVIFFFFELSDSVKSKTSFCEKKEFSSNFYPHYLGSFIIIASSRLEY